MRLTPETVVQHLRDGVYVRLQISGTHGIGVFAIRNIPAGVDPFQERELETRFIKISASRITADPTIPPGVKKYVHDLCSCKGGFVLFPEFGMNGVMPLYYMNHSTTPNVENIEEEGGATFFRTLRPIQEGEELTVDYGTYNDELGI